MNYKRTNIVIILIFALIITCPLILTNTDPDAYSWVDNKALADDPLTAMSEDESVTFTDAVDDYIDDRIGFRQNALDINSRIDYYGFQKSPTDFVVFGDDGWLFCDDGSTLNQAAGLLTYDQGELELIANNMKQIQEYLAERDCEFVLYIAPNKERVYYEELPEYYQEYRVSETCNTDQIVEYLRANTDIRVVWGYEDIEKSIEPETNLYYKLDTHWNKLGAYIGAKSLLNELRIEIPDLKEQTIIEEEKNTGDLYERLGLSPELVMEDTNYSIEGYEPIAEAHLEKNFYGDWIFENTGKDSRRLMIMRDSFCTAMADYIATEFDRVDMIHQNSFKQSMVDELEPDIFVLEIVEKNDFFLCKFTMTDEGD